MQDRNELCAGSRTSKWNSLKFLISGGKVSKIHLRWLDHIGTPVALFP